MTNNVPPSVMPQIESTILRSAATKVFHNDLIHAEIAQHLQQDKKGLVKFICLDKRSFAEGVKVLYKDVKEDIGEHLWKKNCAWNRFHLYLAAVRSVETIPEQSGGKYPADIKIQPLKERFPRLRCIRAVLPLYGMQAIIDLPHGDASLADDTASGCELGSCLPTSEYPKPLGNMQLIISPGAESKSPTSLCMKSMSLYGSCQIYQLHSLQIGDSVRFDQAKPPRKWARPARLLPKSVDAETAGSTGSTAVWDKLFGEVEELTITNGLTIAKILEIVKHCRRLRRLCVYLHVEAAVSPGSMKTTFLQGLGGKLPQLQELSVFTTAEADRALESLRSCQGIRNVTSRWQPLQCYRLDVDVITYKEEKKAARLFHGSADEVQHRKSALPFDTVTLSVPKEIVSENPTLIACALSTHLAPSTVVRIVPQFFEPDQEFRNWVKHVMETRLMNVLARRHFVYKKGYKLVKASTEAKAEVKSDEDGKNDPDLNDIKPAVDSVDSPETTPTVKTYSSKSTQTSPVELDTTDPLLHLKTMADRDPFSAMRALTGRT